MTHWDAFVIVGRDLFWIALALSVPALWTAFGHEESEVPAILYGWGGLIAYAAVILCARYLP